MNIKDKQDIMLDEYFEKYRENINDNGFTKNIMNKIPKEESGICKRTMLLTTSLIIGIIFSIPSIIGNLITCQNIYTLVFILCCCAGIILSIIIAIEPENELI